MTFAFRLVPRNRTERNESPPGQLLASINSKFLSVRAPGSEHRERCVLGKRKAEKWFFPNIFQVLRKRRKTSIPRKKIDEKRRKMKNLISAVSLWFPVNKKTALRLLFKLSLKLFILEDFWLWPNERQKTFLAELRT